MSDNETAQRLASLYQTRARKLAAVLLDARGLIRGIDADLDARIDDTLVAAGFLEAEPAAHRATVAAAQPEPREAAGEGEPETPAERVQGEAGEGAS